MIKLSDNYIGNLLEIEGMIKSLVDLLSFPGSEFLNQDILERNLTNLNTIHSNEFHILKFIDIIKYFNSYELQALMIEYARLFVGPYQVIAPPYGSYYLEEGRLMGDSTIEVNKFYENAGLAINESFKDLPDHIIAELEFLLFLIHNEKNFLAKEDFDNHQIILQMRVAFFNNYVNKWLNKFSYRVIENTKSDFYKSVAEYLLLVVELINMRNKELNI